RRRRTTSASSTSLPIPRSTAASLASRWSAPSVTTSATTSGSCWGATSAAPRGSDAPPTPRLLVSRIFRLALDREPQDPVQRLLVGPVQVTEVQRLRPPRPLQGCPLQLAGRLVHLVQRHLVGHARVWREVRLVGEAVAHRRRRQVELIHRRQ